MSSRSASEIRAAIDRDRAELSASLEQLRGEITEITDWRKQLRSHQREVIGGALVAGFIVGGGLAALFGRRRRR